MNNEATTEQLLDLSVQQYRDLLDHAKKLERMVSATNYAELESHSVEMNNLQAAAQDNDKKLLPSLFYEAHKWQENPLFQKRQELIQGIIDFNREIMPSLQATMAVVAADVDKLHAGWTAVAGYVGHHGKKGKINSSV